MKLKVIGTGSTGNSYLLYTDSETLIIECGVRFSELQKGLNFDFTNVVGCIVTHEHNDHALAINDLAKVGVDVYATAGTLEAKNVTAGIPIEKEELLRLGGFSIIAFKTIHDAADPVGFLIHHNKCGLTLFLTDTAYVEYKFPGLNNIIIEANYCMKIISRNYNADSDLQFLRNRVLKSHFNIDNCIDFLNANDLTQVNNIMLIHLSESNSNEIDFKNRVEIATGKNVTVANKGIEIDFNKTPF